MNDSRQAAAISIIQKRLFVGERLLHAKSCMLRLKMEHTPVFRPPGNEFGDRDCGHDGGMMRRRPGFEGYRADLRPDILLYHHPTPCLEPEENKPMSCRK